MYCHVGMRWGSWVSAGRKGRRRRGGKGARPGSSAKERFQSFVRQRGVDANDCGFLPMGIFSPCGGGFGWFGFGRLGTRVAAGHSRSSYTWRRARAPHPSRSWDRRGPPRGPPPRTPWPFAWTSSFTRLCTAVVDDGGAARVSPARVGAVRRGCARVSPLGRDAGLLLELRTVVDCFRSGRWGRAGVRSGRRVTCVGRKKDTRRVQHNTRPAKRPVRAGRGTTRPELGPGDDRRVIDVARRPCPHRHRERRGVPVARARPPVAPCRSEKSRIWLHKAETARTRSLPLIRPGAPRATFTAVGRGGRTRLRVYTLRRRPLLDLRRRLWPLPPGLPGATSGGRASG